MNFPVLRPNCYHGKNKGHKFFEGWYFKLVSTSDTGDTACIAFVPGIFRSTKSLPEEHHSFIFVNEGGKKQHYFKFPVDAFQASSEKFQVMIDEVNVFTSEKIVIDLKPKPGDDASACFKGEISFHDTTPWPVTKTQPGVMGPFGLIPFLECYHGVVSMNHVLQGTLVVKQQLASSNQKEGSEQVIEFHKQEAHGYIEKDWGRTFPKRWIWIQTNTFANSPGTSVFFSYARVPATQELNLTIKGLICAILHKGRLLKFCTYNFSKVRKLQLHTHDGDNEGHASGNWCNADKLEIVVENWTHKLYLEAQLRGVACATLYGPRNWHMEPFVDEALGASVKVKLVHTKSGQTEFEGMGTNAGLEMHGDLTSFLQ